MARRDEGANWAFVTEKQRRQPECPAWELFRELLLQDTSYEEPDSTSSHCKGG